MSSGQKFLAFGFVFTFCLTFCITSFSPAYAIAQAKATQIEAAEKAKAFVEKIAAGLEEVRELRKESKLDDALKKLRELDEIKADPTAQETLKSSSDVMKLLLQAQRMELASDLINDGQIAAGLDEFRLVQTRYHESIEFEPARESLTLAITLLPQLLVTPRREPQIEPKSEAEPKEWKKHLSDAFDMTGDSLKALRQFESKSNSVTKDSRYIARLLGARSKIAKNIGEPNVSISRKEIELELKRLRDFFGKNTNHENGILALAEMLHSACGGQEYKSQQRLAWLVERDKLLAKATANPDASLQLARVYGSALSSQASRIEYSDPETLGKLDAITAELTKLEQRFPGNFQREIKSSKQRKARWQEHQSKRNR